MSNIESQLEEFISDGFEKVKKYPIGSEEREAYVKELQEMYTIRNDEIRIHAEEKKAYDANELEVAKAKTESKARFWDRIENAGQTGVSVLATIFLTKMLIKFEQTGVASSGGWTQRFPRIKWFNK